MKLAYFVSRYPLTTETFILREFDGLDHLTDVDVELFALFPGQTDTPHRAGKKWLTRVHAGNVAAGAAHLLLWFARAPRRTLSIFGATISAYISDPRFLMRCMVATIVAFAHATRIRQMRIRHVHAHYATYPAQAAWTVSRLCGISYSFTPHAHDIFVRQTGLRLKLESASFVVAISSYNRQFLRHFGGCDTYMPIVRYGVDLDAFGNDRVSIPSVGPVRCLVVSALRAYKGHRYLIEAIGSVRKGSALDRVHLDLVGDGPLRLELERLVSKYRLDGRVTFHGSVSEDQVRQFLQASHIVVQPSVVQGDGDSEGLPNSLIEAMASAVPVVATKVTGIPELVQAHRTGLLVEPNDSGALAQALLQILADPVGASERAERGLELVRREYSIDRLIRDMRGLFASMTQP